jgi:hypothetical protein
LNRDFTISKAKNLLKAFLRSDYSPTTLYNYLNYQKESYNNKVVIIRHDVDRQPQCALEMAALENELKICASYYFRYKKKVFNQKIIKQVGDLGHEIGYHYEVLSKTNGNFDEAAKLFQKELGFFREFVDVKTVCMHGSPLSKWDSKELWHKFDYRKFGIVGEPYFDIDFDKVLYLTDTGRRWNGAKYSIRDKVNSGLNTNIAKTDEIIRKLEEGSLPNVVMVNMHPNRWNENMFPWMCELAIQNLKNVVKRAFIGSGGK